MYKYLFFIIFGILLYLFLNGVENFSIGIPEYQFTIVDGEVDDSRTIERVDGILAVRDDPVYQDPNNDNIYYVYGNDIDDAQRNYDTYIVSRQSMAGGNAATGGGCSVVISESNLEVRVGFEIETCFSNKPSRVSMSVKSCHFINDDTTREIPSGIEFLDTTHSDDSLFKGVPELVSECKSDNDCNVELIINNDKHVLFDGNNFNIDESEFKTSIQDWLDNNITSCGKYAGGEPSDANSGRSILVSTCGVHLHISVPNLETNEDYIKDLFKILVFYLWFTEYQDRLKSENPNYVTVGWRDAPYIPLTELEFPLPDASQIITMVSDPDTYIDMIQAFADTLPGQNYSNDFSEIAASRRGVYQSNVIIVDKRYNNPFPHFEFRGHYDLMKSISSPDLTVDLVYEHLKNYTHSIWEVLNEAHNILK